MFRRARYESLNFHVLLQPVAEHDYNYVDSNEDHPTYDRVHFGEMM